MKGKKYTSIATKILGYFMLLLIVPVVISTVLQTLVSTRQLNTILDRDTSQILKHADTILSYVQDNIELTAQVIEQDSTVQYFLSGHTMTDDEKGYVLELLNVLSKHDRGITNVIICRKDGSWISPTLSPRSRDSLLLDDWYRDSVAAPSDYLFSSNPVNRNLQSKLGYSPDEVISVSKALFDQQGNVQGVLSIDLMVDYLEKEILPYIVGSAGFVYITDLDGNNIYAPCNEVVHRINSHKLSKNLTHAQTISVNGTLYRVASLRSDVLPWNIFGVFLYSDISSLPNTIRNISLVFLLCTILLALLYSRNINSLIVSPILQLNDCMKEVEDGDLTVRFQTNQENEIGILGNSFNHMVQHTDELLALLKKEGDEKRLAEYRILQEQIKPHFLYNTLETVHWMAIESGNTEISELIMALTKFFKISLSGGSEFIPLQKEIEHVSSYLAIQKIRYEDMFSFSVHYSSDLPDCTVLKLMLQPIVENALYHGIKEDSKPGNITIDISPDGSDILFKVIDTGVGMKKDQVDALNQMFKEKANHGGYGLYNVNCRLIYHFGNAYRLRIESEPGAGTTVYIRHPVREQNDA